MSDTIEAHSHPRPNSQFECENKQHKITFSFDYIPEPKKCDKETSNNVSMPVGDKEMKTDRYTITPTDIWGTPVSDILADILGGFFTYTQNINQCT